MWLERHLLFKYPAWALVLAVLLGACTAPAAVATASPTAAPTASPVPTPSPTPALAAAIPATVAAGRRWHLLPDGLGGEPATIRVQFAGDPAAGRPVARVRGTGTEVPLTGTPGATLLEARIPLSGLPAARHQIDVVERLAGGRESVVATSELIVSQPAYVVWTLDFEGDESADPELANTAAIADGLRVPMTILWNPRAWSTPQVRPARAEAMLAWTKDRLSKGDEVGLHLHGWTDWMRAAGVTPRTAPSWAGRGDGYDVPLTAYDESEQRTMIEYALRQMAERGLPKPTSFRAGGQFANAATLRTLVAAGFTADCSAVPGASFGALRLPWSNLPPDAQPYRPSRDDAARPGDLPILESPTIGGNTYAYTVSSIQSIIRADLAMLAPAGEPAKERRTLNVVSHPGTIVPAERAAIESLFKALAPLRHDADAGPLRFITLAQLAQAYR